MRRFLIAAFVLTVITVGGVGCMNVSRLGCEMKRLYVDIQTNLFGIDYPHGIPTSTHQKYYNLVEPGKQPLCDD